MNSAITPEIREITAAPRYRPAVSIIIPLQTKINLNVELAYVLKTAAERVEQMLLKDYPKDVVGAVMQKLNTVIGNINQYAYKNFNTHKSIAIYVSPLFEKVMYLDVAVEEKIIIDESFEIRDLIYSKKQLYKYLVLILSNKKSSIYVYDSNNFVKIPSNVPESVDAYINEVPQRVANFSDMDDRKEVIMDKFLLHIDKSLDDVLNAYHLPLFVLGAERLLGHFNKISKHKNTVIKYVQGNYEDVGFAQLREILEPHILEWKKSMQHDLLNQLEDAADKKKLAFGMENVWREAMNNKGHLLIVENNYMYPARHGDEPDIIYGINELQNNNISDIKDAVDDAMEKVLQSGGSVEFVDEGALKDYGHIALVQYY